MKKFNKFGKVVAVAAVVAFSALNARATGEIMPTGITSATGEVTTIQGIMIGIATLSTLAMVGISWIKVGKKR